MRIFKIIFSNVMIDNEFNYHKLGCRLFNHRFTVIQNHYGKKLYDCEIKYCPCCGEKMR